MITSITKALVAKRSELAKDDKGFTLIELLVVVLIIGILAAIAIPVFLGQQDGAKDKSVEAAITNAKTAVVAQMTDSGTLPTALTEVTSYTPSADIPVTYTPAADKKSFVISGQWKDGGHKYTITDKTAATKVE